MFRLGEKDRDSNGRVAGRRPEKEEGEGEGERRPWRCKPRCFIWHAPRWSESRSAKSSAVVHRDGRGTCCIWQSDALIWAAGSARLGFEGTGGLFAGMRLGPSPAGGGRPFVRHVRSRWASRTNLDDDGVPEGRFDASISDPAHLEIRFARAGAPGNSARPPAQ